MIRFSNSLEKYTWKCYMLLYYCKISPLFANLHIIIIICTKIHETYTLMMWIYGHYSNWQSWRVKGEAMSRVAKSKPHQFYYPKWLSCDCNCVKCYSLGLLYTPTKCGKCKLPQESSIDLDFVVRPRRVECQCLHGYKKTLFFGCKCK